MSSSDNPHNFANLPKDELREIAAKGGRHSHGDFSHDDTQRSSDNLKKSQDTTMKTSSVDQSDEYEDVDKQQQNTSGGRSQGHGRGFAAMAESDPERLREIAAKGGRHSHGQQRSSDE